MAIGVSSAGYWGACAAWAGFTLPPAAAMIIFALGMVNHGDAIPAEWLDGFKAVAVAVVAQAVWEWAAINVRRLASQHHGHRGKLALLLPAWGQVLIIGIAGLAGFRAISAGGSNGRSRPPADLYINCTPGPGLPELVVFCCSVADRTLPRLGATVPACSTLLSMPAPWPPAADTSSCPFCRHRSFRRPGR